jgi:hypothetical protein
VKDMLAFHSEPNAIKRELSADHPSGKQIRAGLGELDISAALMPFKPSFFNRAVKRSAELIWRAAGLQELGVDQLDINPAILHGLGGAARPNNLMGRPLSRPMHQLTRYLRSHAEAFACR